MCDSASCAGDEVRHPIESGMVAFFIDVHFIDKVLTTKNYSNKFETRC